MPTVPNFDPGSVPPGAAAWTLQDVFVDLGHFIYLIQQANIYYGTTLPTQVNAAAADYSAGDIAIIDRLYSTLASFQSSPFGFLGFIQSICNNVIIQEINKDKGLTDLTIQSGIIELCTEMILSGETVQQCAVTAASAAVFTPVGNPVFIFSLFDVNGNTLENIFAETMTATCTGDAQLGSITPLREPFQIIGQIPASSPLSLAWPAGSGSSSIIPCTDAFQQQIGGTSGNILANGSFESWFIPNTPDSWNILIGSAGTQILSDFTTFYDGLSSLVFVGDSATNTSIYQKLRTNSEIGDTVVRALPNSQLAVNCWIKVDVVPASGGLRIALVDASDTVINDNLGNANSITKTLSGATTGFLPFHGTFRLPNELPSAVRLSLELTTPLSTGSSLFIDRIALTYMPQTYTGGPFVAMFSGSIPSILGDTYNLTFTNDQGGKFQRAFDMIFGMKQMGLVLPSSGSPTISDSLIT